MMDYEQKYKEALERAKNFHANMVSDGIRYTVEEIFPELKESEDERMRKALIRFFQWFPYDRLNDENLKPEEAIAWLEKQKPVEQNSEDERIRKALLDACNLSYSDLWEKRGVKKESIIAWLEKQGEQKHSPQNRWKPSDANTTSGTSNWPNYLKKDSHGL